MAIVLASASPRRKELLEQIGCSFIIDSSSVSEDNNRACSPTDLALGHAAAKALDVASRHPASDIVIGADTVVVHNRKVYGKPADIDDARRMLRELSGCQHEVITGVAVAYNGRLFTDHAVTKVFVRPLQAGEIENYLASGEPMDKAGAYGIQGLGTLLIESIQGCYTNVVGLPLVTLARLLSKAGVRLL